MTHGESPQGNEATTSSRLQPELLPQLLRSAAAAYPEHTAIREVAGGGEIGYRELLQLSDQLSDHLRTLGVARGDRVGICLGKSIDAVASIFGILQAGAAYVPVDPSAPASRNATILADCAVRVLIVEQRFVPALPDELAARGCHPHRMRRRVRSLQQRITMPTTTPTTMPVTSPTSCTPPDRPASPKA
jgi:acyl-CoA synthetase (AMP-forming)/AMP-acid ligase II